VFLAEALADLDAHLGVGEVHLAADVSGYSNRREQALRERLASHGCTVRFHANTITVVEPGAITPETPGGEAFIRQLAWRDFHHQVLAAPDPTGSSILSGRPNATTPTGDYVRRYLPELQDIPGPAVHQPWKLDLHHRARLHYPDPIIDLRDGADYFRTAREKAATMASVEPGGEQ
jgi:deoxyribodipyrimidine photolyase